MNIRNAAALLSALALACVMAIPAAAQTMTADSSGWPMQGTKHAITGSLSTAGTSASIQLRGDFNFSLWGTFSATCAMERTFDGTTWLPLTALGTALNWTGPASETLSEPEYGVSYHVKCSPITSGTVNYRVSE